MGRGVAQLGSATVLGSVPNHRQLFHAFQNINKIEAYCFIGFIASQLIWFQSDQNHTKNLCSKWVRP